MIMNKEEIFKKGTEYANKHWNVLENPNEHDNAREDFINGALEVVKNCSIPLVMPSFIVTYKEDGFNKELYWQVNTKDEAEAEGLFWKSHDVLCTIIDIKPN